MIPDDLLKRMQIQHIIAFIFFHLRHELHHCMGCKLALYSTIATDHQVAGDQMLAHLKKYLRLKASD